MAAVIDRARHYARQLEQEALDGPDPRDIGRRGLEELATLVVGLKDGKRVDHAPGVEEEHEPGGHLQPGHEASIRWWWRPSCVGTGRCGRCGLFILFADALLVGRVGVGVG